MPRTNSILDEAVLNIQSANINVDILLDRVYRAVVQRPADDLGLKGWRSALNAGTSADEVVAAIITSDEVQRLVDPLVRLYQVALGRLPDAEGLAGWANAIRSGRLTLDDVVDQVLTSQEFLDRFRTSDTLADRPALLQQLFRDNLGRDVDPIGREGFGRADVTLAAIIEGIAQSKEFIDRADPFLAQYYIDVVRTALGLGSGSGPGGAATVGGQGPSLFDLNPLTPGAPQTPPAAPAPGVPPAAPPPVSPPVVNPPPGPAPVDVTAPTLAITIDDPLIGLGERATVRFTFSEEVRGFDASDVSLLTGFQLASFDPAGNGVAYSASFEPISAFSPTGGMVAVANDSYTDVAGNTGAGAQASFTYDAQAPNAPVVQGFVDDSGSPVAFTRDMTPTVVVTGVAPDVTRVDIVTQNGDVVGPATRTAGGWAYTFAPLASGNYSYAAVAEDAAGNRSGPSAPSRVTIDTIAPVPVITLSDALVASGDQPTVSFNFAEDVFDFGLADVVVSPGFTITGLSPAGNGRTFSGTLAANAATTDQEGTISVGALGYRDLVGNPGGAAQATFIYDRTPPDAPVIINVGDDTGVSDSDRITKDTTLTITGTASRDTALITIFNDANQNGVLDFNESLGTTQPDAGQWSFTTDPLSDGIVNLTALASDASGNLSAFTNQQWTVNTRPIIFSIDYNNPSSSLSVTFSETVYGFGPEDVLLSPTLILDSFSTNNNKEFIIDFSTIDNFVKFGGIEVFANGTESISGVKNEYQFRAFIL